MTSKPPPLPCCPHPSECEATTCQQATAYPAWNSTLSTQLSTHSRDVMHARLPRASLTRTYGACCGPSAVATARRLRTTCSASSRCTRRSPATSPSRSAPTLTPTLISLRRAGHALQRLSVHFRSCPDHRGIHGKVSLSACDAAVVSSYRQGDQHQKHMMPATAEDACILSALCL